MKEIYCYATNCAFNFAFTDPLIKVSVDPLSRDEEGLEYCQSCAHDLKQGREAAILYSGNTKDAWIYKKDHWHSLGKMSDELFKNYNDISCSKHCKDKK